MSQSLPWRLAAALLLALLGCEKAAPPPASPPVPAQKPMTPWSWYPLGSIAVIEGEVTQPEELALKGNYIRETRDVEPGPVRWEILRPPRDEVAVLTTSGGKVLAKFVFSTPTPKPATPPLRPAGVPPRADPLAPGAREPGTPEAGAPESESLSPDTRRPKAGIAVPEPSPARVEPRPAPVPPKPPPQAQPARTAETPKPPVPSPPAPRPPAPKAPGPALEPRPQLPEPRPAAPEAPPSTPMPDDLWPGAGGALNLIRGPRGGHRIALTFDGGSNAESAKEILDVLKDRRTRCTFFLTGAFIRKHPDVVLRISREGHEIGNHTLSHPHLAPRQRRSPSWTREKVQQELLAADQLLLRLTGRPMEPLWRAPYGEHTAEIRRWAEELGYRHVAWSEGADTLDWATEKERRLYRTGEAILARLHARMQQSDGDGLVVLMHLGSDRPVEDRPARQLRAFMDRASREGWSFVAVGDYVRELGKPAWNASRRVALLETHSPATGAPGRR